MYITTSTRVLVCVLVLLGSSVHADDLAASDEQLLKDTKVGTDDKSLRDFFRKRSPTPQDLVTIDTLVKQLSDRSFQRRKRASEELIAWGPAAYDSLRRTLKSEDLEAIRRAEQCLAEIERAGNELPQAAIRQLARNKASDGSAILLAYVPNADDEVVTQTVYNALRVLCDAKKPDEALFKALKDVSPIRRAAAVHVLGRHPEKAVRTAAMKLLADPEPNVRFRAAESLLLAREKVAVLVLIDLLRVVPSERRWEIDDLLSRLPTSIKSEPEIPLGPGEETPESLRQYRDRWAAWWNSYESAADLTKMEERPAYQNVTLVPEMHAHKVWEFGPDGKIRWEVKSDLKSPIDAQTLPNGRFLVAELDGNRVTERDRTGKIHWQHDVKQPIYVRRMTNGNTFISTNHACFIVNASNKELFRYEAGGGFFIHSVQQMPNGHIVAISMEGDVREIGPDGKVIRSLPLQERGSWSGIEGLPGNRYLCVGASKIREIDATGKVVWKVDYQGACYATRLPNGNTLVVDNSRGLAEINKEGKAVWTRNISSSLWRAHRR